MLFLAGKTTILRQFVAIKRGFRRWWFRGIWRRTLWVWWCCKLNFNSFLLHLGIDEYTFVQEINEEDERALALFMNPNPTPRKTLADIILEKITEKHTEIQSQYSEIDSENNLVHLKVPIPTCFPSNFPVSMKVCDFKKLILESNQCTLG